MRRQLLGLSGGGLVSKLLGLCREVLLARFFGTGPVADAYRAATTATLSPAHLITNRVIQTCFIPAYTRYRSSEPQKARALLQTALLLSAAIAVLVGALLFALAGPIVSTVLAGFDPERRELAVGMLRIMALGVTPYIYSVLLGALGAAQDDFVIPSLRPGLVNLGLITMIVTAALAGRPLLIAWGFTLSYLALAVWGTVFLLRRRLFPRGWVLDRSLARGLTGEMWRLARPMLLASLLFEGNLLVERHLSSLIGAGTIASIDYARFVTETCHALLVFPLALVGLSRFATLDRDELDRQVDRTLALLFLVLVPLSAFLAANGGGLLRVLYLRGSFDREALATTHLALLGLSVGLWLWSASYVLARVLNARLRNDVVLRGEGLFVLLNVAFNLLFFRRLGILALGLGPSVAALGSLLYYLRGFGLRGRVARRSLVALAIAVPPYIAACLWLGPLVDGPAALAVTLPGTVVYWGGWVLAVPGLRRLLLGALGGR